VRLTCPAASGGCTGRLKLRSTTGNRKSLAPAAKFAIGEGRSRRVTVRLNTAALKRLARKHRLKASAVAVARDSNGRSRQSRAQLVLVT
jgi:hypothetical protein